MCRPCVLKIVSQMPIPSIIFCCILLRCTTVGNMAAKTLYRVYCFANAVHPSVSLYNDMT